MNNEEFSWNETPQAAVQRWFELPTTKSEEWATIKKMLADEINRLIKNDFEKLLHILYRIDINEQQAMKALSYGNAAELLTDLIIERQLQKVESRKRN